MAVIMVSVFQGSEVLGSEVQGFKGSGIWLLVPGRWLLFYVIRITSDPFLLLFNL
jgi:hypothetical protein